MKSHCARPAFFALALAGMLSSGCASLHSRESRGDDAAPSGLVYYLPMQELVLTLTVDDKKKRTVSVAPSPMLPDLRQRFVAQYQRSQLTQNTLDLTVTGSGLLNSEQKGTATTQVALLLDALAGVVAIRSSGDSITGPTNNCLDQGTYSVAIDPLKPRTTPWCGLAIKVASTRDSPPGTTSISFGTGISTYTATNGFYYRQALPVRMQIDDLVSGSSWVAYPTYVSAEGPVHFLPIPRSLFANSSWNVTFAFGVPTVYKPSTDSEVLGIAKLPASVVSAYSTALLAGWKREQSEMQGQAALQAEYIKLVQQELKYQACREAVASNDPALIAEKCK